MDSPVFHTIAKTLPGRRLLLGCGISPRSIIIIKGKREVEEELSLVYYLWFAGCEPKFYIAVSPLALSNFLGGDSPPRGL